MKIPDHRLYSSTVWGLSAFMLASGALLLILMLSNVIGPFRFGAMNESPVSRAIGFWIPGDGARSETSRRTEAWRRLLPRDDVLVESGRLRDLLNAGVRVVILPDARSLTAEQAAALDRFMQTGGGVMLSGSIGVRSKAGEWLGYDVMRRLLRVSTIVPLPREQSGVLVANQRGPVSAMLGPGAQFKVMSEPGVPALEGRQSELLWAGAASHSNENAAASRRVRLGPGRLAWVGPGPEVVSEARNDDRDALQNTLRSAIAWVRGRPTLELRAWPGNAPFAVSIEKRVDTETRNMTAGARFELEETLLASLDSAFRTGTYVPIEIPSTGPHDVWAEALKTRLLATLRARGAWLATRQDVRDWLAMRSQILFSITSAGPHRMLVNISNRAEGDLAEAGLRLWVNRPAASITVDPLKLGQALPSVSYDRASESAYLDLPDLGARSTVSFYIDIDDSEFDESAVVRSD